MQASDQLPMTDLLKEFARLCQDQGLIAQFSIYPDKAEIQLSGEESWMAFSNMQLLIYLKGLLAGARIITKKQQKTESQPIHYLPPGQ